MMPDYHTSTLRNVLVAREHRIHIVPRVGSNSLQRAFANRIDRFDSPEVDGPETRIIPVRHPVERMLSVWAMFCHGFSPFPVESLQQLGITYGMSLDAFADIALSADHDEPHLRAQARYHAGQTDGLVRLENLASAWPESLPPLLWVNTADFRPVCPAHLRPRIEQYYAYDMALYEDAK